MTTGPNFYHWYCQHVLPLVYDESLSYYEVLCKLTKAMGDLTKNQQDYFQEVDKAIDAMEQVINVAWPQFQQTVNKAVSDFESEVNTTLEGYETDYTKFTDDWNEKLSGNQEALDSMQNQITYLDQQLTTKLQEQDANIAAALQSNLNIINAAIAAQNKKIDDFITEYDPTPIPTIMYPQAVVTTSPASTVVAILSGTGGKTITATANSEGVAILNLPAYGNWNLRASSIQGASNIISLTVDNVKQYAVNAPIIPPSLKIHIGSTVPASTAACFNQSMYKITKPDSTTSTVPAEANETVTETFSAPGTYTVEWMAANVIPTNTTAEGFIKTGTSIIYTSVQSKTVTLSSTTAEQTINFTPATMTITCDPAHTIEVTPPVVTESKTMVSTTQSPYVFLPWTNGLWIVKDETSGIDKGYRYISSIINVEFSILPGTLDLSSVQDSITIPWPINYDRTQQTTLYPSDHAPTDFNHLNSLASKLSIICGGLSLTGKFIGYIFNSYFTNNKKYYQYEDGTEFLETHLIGYTLNKFHIGSNFSDTYEIRIITNASRPGDNIFKDRNNMEHDAIFYIDNSVTSDHTIVPGLVSSNEYVAPSTVPPQYSNYPSNIENIRFDQAWFIEILIMSTVGVNYYEGQLYKMPSGTPNIDLDVPAKLGDNKVNLINFGTTMHVQSTDMGVLGANQTLHTLGTWNGPRVPAPAAGTPPDNIEDFCVANNTNSLAPVGSASLQSNRTGLGFHVRRLSASGAIFNRLLNFENRPSDSHIQPIIAYLDN